MEIEQDHKLPKYCWIKLNKRCLDLANGEYNSTKINFEDYQADFVPNSTIKESKENLSECQTESETYLDQM